MLIVPLCSDVTLCQPVVRRVMKQPTRNEKPARPVTTVHVKSMWGALKGLPYWFFIDKDQSIYQWLQEGRQEHWKRGKEGGATAVMDYWKGNVQNVLCLVCALHFKGLAQKKGSCQHLQTCSEKMQPYCTKKQNRGEKNDVTLSLKHHRAMRNHPCAHTHQHVPDTLSLLSSVSCSPRVMKSIKKDNPSLQLSPPALSSDGGLIKSAGILWGCWIIHLQSVTQPTALFHITYAEFRGVRTVSVRLRRPGFGS